MARSLLQASTLVSLALLFSRLSGLIREQVLGARLGLSAEMDAAVLILTLPDLLVGLLLSGGFAAALVPALTRAPPEARIQLTRRVMSWTGLAALALAVTLFAAMPLVLAALAPASDLSQLAGFPLGLGLSFLALPVAAIIGVSSSYLNAVGKYAIPALTVLAFNGLLALYFFFGLGAGPVDFALFGLMVLLASLVRFGLQAVRMQGFARRSAGVHHFAPNFTAQFFQGVMGAALLVGMPIIFRSLYALGGPGDLATFNYALRLFELPMGILIAPIIVIFLPLLSAVPSAQDPLFRQRANLAICTAFVLGLTGALVGAIYARPIAALLFGFGALAGDGSEAIAQTIQVLLIALPFMAVFQALSTALNASHRTGHVLLYSAIALALALVLYAVIRGGGLSVSFAAKAGFVAFSMLASGIGLYGVFGGAAMLRSLWQLGIIALRTCAVALPFAWFWPSSRDNNLEIIDFVLLAALGLALLAVNLPVLRELAAIRDGRSETT